MCYCHQQTQQHKTTQVGHTPSGWLQITEQLQRHVCGQFGVSTVVGLQLIRRAEWIFVGEEDAIIEMSLYRKCVRMRSYLVHAFNNHSCVVERVSA
jgi:hypothetical protein